MPVALVVDDARVIRILLSHRLKELGYEVIEAANGKEALEKLSQAPSVQIALIDWIMPVMSGIECLKAIRADARFASMPVVMVTNETEMDHIVSALEAGATDYIMKPFTPEVISEKLLLLGLIDPQPV
jgi:two-component system, chemotaxis family, chemotaxis protein CheY